MGNESGTWIMYGVDCIARSGKAPRKHKIVYIMV